MQQTNRQWLKWAEYGAVGTSAVGAIVAAVSQQAAFAAVPLTLTLGVNLANRQRLESLTQRNGAVLVNVEKSINSLSGQLKALPASTITPLQDNVAQLERLIATVQEELASSQETLVDVNECLASWPPSVDISELQQEFSKRQTDVTKLRQEVWQLKASIAELRDEQNILVEDKFPDLNQILVNLKPQYNYELVHNRSKSRSLLKEGLNSSARRLILVCPWLNNNSIQTDIIQDLEKFIIQGGQVEIGWGSWKDLKKVGNLQDGNIRRKLLDVTEEKWKYEALYSLEELEQRYPSQFKLKLLGTHEKYLIVSNPEGLDSWVMIGSHNFLTSHSIDFGEVNDSQERELGLKTNDPYIVNQLIRNFDMARNLEKIPKLVHAQT